MSVNKFSLKNKVSLITGGNGILGTKFAEGLLKAGATVLIVDVTKNKDDSLVKYGDRIQSYKCDVTSKESVQKIIKSIVKKYGTIDILLNNAATKTSNITNFFKPFESYDLETWQDVMKVNVDGMFLVAQAVGSVMKKQKNGGSIIQTSSIYGLVGPDSRIYEGSNYLGGAINTPAVYSASKAAVIGLTKWLAVYWAKNNIRVNCLVPGGIESGQNEAFISQYSEKVPMGRMGNPDEIVPTVLYLASDASSYVTGQTLIVDGGFTAW
ncbi:SDR family oxidoreductase [Gammaproteobacteria bacterium]|nr:SDR family oxidoreductase [Gammaproteobacteria bacterium]